MNRNEQARLIIDLEISALNRMAERLSPEFDKAIEIIDQMKGRVVVSGMGKSGIIGQKIAATLASTGTPAFFVHPGEAFHGDLGMIKSIDVALLISNSGETEEIIRIVPFLRYQGNKIIAFTGNHKSTLAKFADTVLDVGVDREACINDLAPTSSTTCALVMGDALAVVLSDKKNFKPEDFARFHPGGSLGRKLLTRVMDIMHSDNLPVCSPDATLKNVVSTITRGRLGLVLVTEESRLIGVITDGDIRRAFDKELDFNLAYAKSIMTHNPKVVSPNLMLADVEKLMALHKINTIIVADDDKVIQGVVQIFDLEKM